MSIGETFSLKLTTFPFTILHTSLYIVDFYWWGRETGGLREQHSWHSWERTKFQTISVWPRSADLQWNSLYSKAHMFNLTALSSFLYRGSDYRAIIFSTDSWNWLVIYFSITYVHLDNSFGLHKVKGIRAFENIQNIKFSVQIINCNAHFQTSKRGHSTIAANYRTSTPKKLFFYAGGNSVRFYTGVQTPYPFIY